MQDTKHPGEGEGGFCRDQKWRLLVGRLQEGNFGSAAFWDWKSAVLSVPMPLELLAGVVPSVPCLQRQK